MSEPIDLNGSIVGSYYAIWLGLPEPLGAGGRTGDQRVKTIGKLNASIGQKIIVSVYRLDLGNGIRYTCRVPGHPGFFGFDQFAWFGSVICEGEGPQQQIRNVRREEEQITREKALAKAAYDKTRKDC